MWETYSNKTKYLPDFLVKYELYKTEDGGRKKPPYQGYRCDFSYDGDDIQKDGIFMIYPEFLDEHGNEILEDNEPIPMKGRAYMWILIPEMRKTVHVNRIKIGVKGYFMEGPRRVGQVEVIDIIGLIENTKINLTTASSG